MKEKRELKILLLQIRDDEVVRQEEYQSFLTQSTLAPSQIIIHNVFDKPEFDVNIVDGFDALIVGGASEASVSEEDIYTFVGPCKKLLNYCVEKNIPVFASCFGFQVAVLAFGGEILKDELDYEIGTLLIELTSDCSSDPLYCDMHTPFMAVSVHKEKALVLPENCQLLAYTNSCLHSFRVIGKPFWAFQFHPELTREKLTQRLGVYKSKYTDDLDHFNQIIDSLVDTPESNLLVKKFVDYLISC
ncbi:MAG: type 1 glutamine amidotransferase [Bacteriovoracaceae bacterium]|nr:type 1 glutamine amidotransferase [Bacteriovoracaceae bacterium]